MFDKLLRNIHNTAIAGNEEPQTFADCCTPPLTDPIVQAQDLRAQSTKALTAGDRRAAIDLLTAELSIRQKISEYDPDIITLYSNLACLHFLEGEATQSFRADHYKQAEQLLIAGIQLADSRGDQTATTDSERLRGDLAHLLENMDRTTEAEAILTSLTSWPNPETTYRIHRKLSLELFYKRQNRPQDAIPLAAEGLEYSRSIAATSSIPSTQVASYLSRLWRYYADLHQRAFAVIYARQFVTELEAVKECLEPQFYKHEREQVTSFLKKE